MYFLELVIMQNTVKSLKKYSKCYFKIVGNINKKHNTFDNNYITYFLHLYILEKINKPTHNN